MLSSSATLCKAKQSTTASIGPRPSIHLCRARKREFGTRIRFDNGEREVGLSSIGIVESIPESVPLAKQITADGIPVFLRVGDAGNSLPALGPLAWPTGLRHPHGLALCDGLRGCDSIKEETLGLADGIGLGRFEIGKRVVAEEVTGIDDRRVLP